MSKDELLLDAEEKAIDIISQWGTVRQYKELKKRIIEQILESQPKTATSKEKRTEYGE